MKNIILLSENINRDVSACYCVGKEMFLVILYLHSTTFAETPALG